MPVSGAMPTKSPHMATTTLKVQGMTCGACTSAVESGFKDVSGVGNVSVSLVMERAVISHDPDIISAEKCKEIIEDRGFDADILSSDTPQADEEEVDDAAGTAGDTIVTEESTSGMVQTTVSVGGMTCGACTSAVEGAFKDIAGIKSFSISLLSERAVLEHDSNLISPEKIVEEIEDVGFDATLIESTPVSTPEVIRSRSKKQKSGQSAVTTTTIAIEGMTCGACTSAVEGGFKDIPGLIRFNISLLAERAVVTHDPVRLTPAQIAEIIEDRGFDAKVLSSVEEGTEATSATNTIQLKIYGLQDPEAGLALSSTLLEHNGITRAIVTFKTSRAAITYRPAQTRLRAIVHAIEGAGYNALVAENEDNNAQLESLAKTKEIQEWSRAFRVSLCFAIPVFLTSMVFPMFLPFLNFGRFQVIPGLWLGDIVCLLLTIPVQFGIGRRFYVSAFKSLRHGSPTMDVLVVLGTSAAFFFSCAAMLVSLFSSTHSKPATIFDTSTMLITFILLGRFLENRAKGQTSKALSRLMSLAPSSAIIYADPIAAAKVAESWDEKTSGGEKGSAEKENGSSAIEEQVVPTELLEVGDVVILRPGDKIPADGVVTRGESYVDESMVTGEAMPILKITNMPLMAGTVNGAGRVDFKVTRAGRDTQLSQIVRLVQEAQTSRAPIQRLADTVAGYFVPIIITLGLATFSAWMVLSHLLPTPPKIFTDDASGGRFMVCVKLCIAVIVFACPCALGLATPTAVMVGTGVGAEQGILIKGGATLETATKITRVVMDKTGTLTVGKMSVSKADLKGVWATEPSKTRLWWALIGLAESSSEHPIAKAIFNSAKTHLRLGIEGFIDGSVGEFESTVGKGITATVEATISPERKRYEVSIGNASYLRSRGVSIPPSPEEQYDAYATDVLGNASSSSKASDAGATTIHTAISGEYTGTLSLSDTLKPTAAAAIAALRRMGIPTSIVTGDQAATAHHVAALLNIPAADVHASVLPSGKRAIIEGLQAKGEIVAMVGDGINDSPALATANVGISLSSGTDVAMEAADIVLMKPENLLDVPTSLQLSRSIFNRIRLNLLWACVYNAIGLPIAMGFLLPWGITLPPLAAGAAMACSSVTVVASSLLLKWWKRPKWLEGTGEMENVKGSGGGKSRSVFSKIVASMTGRQDEVERGAYMPLRDLEAAT